MKHDWYTSDRYNEGIQRVDIWRLDYDYHNGPQCRRCDELFCQHCDPECWEEECPSGQLDLF